MRKKKYILYFAAAAAAAGLGLGACSSGTGAQKETASSVSAGQQTAVSGASESGTESETGYENGQDVYKRQRDNREADAAVNTRFTGRTGSLRLLCFRCNQYNHSK